MSPFRVKYGYNILKNNTHKFMVGTVYIYIYVAKAVMLWVVEMRTHILITNIAENCVV